MPTVIEYSSLDNRDFDYFQYWD